MTYISSIFIVDSRQGDMTMSIACSESLWLCKDILTICRPSDSVQLVVEWVNGTAGVAWQLEHFLSSRKNERFLNKEWHQKRKPWLTVVHCGTMRCQFAVIRKRRRSWSYSKEVAEWPRCTFYGGRLHFEFPGQWNTENIWSVFNGASDTGKTTTIAWRKRLVFTKETHSKWKHG